MKFFHKTLSYKTDKFIHFLDITEDVQAVILESKIKNGLAVISSLHTTASVRINEKERGIVGDFEEFVKRLLPPEKYYRHNDLTIRTENLVCEPGASDCLNGHSHLLHLLMGTSENVIISEGKPVLGTFQRIFLIELDCARKRRVAVKVFGE